jgi:cysteine-rich repeat protein
LFLNANGTVALHRKISAGLGNFAGPLAINDNFGSALAAPRDLDGDGVADLVVGAWNDDTGGTNRGAAYVLFLDGVPGAFCGDDTLDPSEQCDDGNKGNGDCCSSTCALDPVNTPCPNGDVCDGDEVCNANGDCIASAPLVCNDGDPCTQDLCDPINGCQASFGPAPVCLHSARAKIDIVDKPDDAQDRLDWRWMKGDETFLTDFGQPNSSTTYALCVYDGEAGVPQFETRLLAPSGTAWRSSGKSAFKYRDSGATADGLKSIVLKAGGPGKAKIILKARGLNLPTPVPEGPSAFFQQTPSVIVQLINSSGVCWSTEFTPPASTNLDARFTDLLP